MFSKIWLINLVLVSLSIIMGFNAYNIWVEDEQKAVIQNNKENELPFSTSKFSSRKTLPESAYRVIIDKNLFSPDREEFIPDEVEPEVQQVNISGRKITLYGVVIMDNYQKALIDNPERKPDERPNKWVQVGDTVGNLTIAAINNESILLKEGAKKYEILLYDEKKRRTNASAVNKSSSPNIVSTKPTQKKAKHKKVSKQEEVAQGEYEIIKTPFGNIKRRKK